MHNAGEPNSSPAWSTNTNILHTTTDVLITPAAGISGTHIVTRSGESLEQRLLSALPRMNVEANNCLTLFDQQHSFASWDSGDNGLTYDWTLTFKSSINDIPEHYIRLRIQGRIVPYCWLLAAGCWLLAAGCCWLLLAAAGGCWLLLARCCWLLLAAEEG